MFTKIKSDRHFSNAQIVDICSNVLQYYDYRLVRHGERVAYIASQVRKELEKDDIEFGTLILLSILHDIGAYKTEEIDQMVQFECEGILPHCVAGYLLLKTSNLFDEEICKILLYHHICDDTNKDYPYKTYSDLIFLADRTDIALALGESTSEILDNIKTLGFDKKYVIALEKTLNNVNFTEEFQRTNYIEYLKDRVLEDKKISSMMFDVLVLLVLTIDFKSEDTMLHSFATAAACEYIAKKIKFDEIETENLCFAAFIHDIGKVAIPNSILEAERKLTADEIKIMQTHVNYTKEILQGIVPEEVVQIAIHHHEKINGSGYPYGLKGDALSVSDKIIAVMDIFAALTKKRSYKAAYGKEKVINILEKMKEDNLLDSSVVDSVVNNFDDIYIEMEAKIADYTAACEMASTEYEVFLQSEIIT